MDSPEFGQVWTMSISTPFIIPPNESKELHLTKELSGLPIWYPRQWGTQPLLNTHFFINVDDIERPSDSRQASIGVREITSRLNAHDDIVFYVNRKPFQVLGAGYSSDIFLRWDRDYFTNIATYALDMGLNTIRLEGKMEQPEIYDIADRLGIMILPSWECCDKWEAWSYNTDMPDPRIWDTRDYSTANSSMRHEAAMLQTHPSVLGFMVGSDIAPDDEVTSIYVEALEQAGWQTPIISAGSSRKRSKLLGPSGMKMRGPYDWVPPNYWWDTSPKHRRYGAAFGFGSELGAGVGTPEKESLTKFLGDEGVEEMWRSPNSSFYHNGAGDTFSSRRIYNDALWNRMGRPTDSTDYVIKAQMMDYEATRAQFEAYSAKWNAGRPATGMIYWMLNNAWPSTHWNLFDFYLRAAGSYFGAKIGSRLEHVAFDPVHEDVYLINHSLDRRGHRWIELDIIAANGTIISRQIKKATSEPNTSKKISYRVNKLKSNLGLVFLQLKLIDPQGLTISRNVYWLTGKIDKLDWAASNFYFTPVKAYVDFSDLDRLTAANVTVVARKGLTDVESRSPIIITLENQSRVPAVFVRLNLVIRNPKYKQAEGEPQYLDWLPVMWEENYVTLMPGEEMTIVAKPLTDGTPDFLQVTGKNIVTVEEFIPL